LSLTHSVSSPLPQLSPILPTPKASPQKLRLDALSPHRDASPARSREASQTSSQGHDKKRKREEVGPTVVQHNVATKKARSLSPLATPVSSPIAQVPKTKQSRPTDSFGRPLYGKGSRVPLQDYTTFEHEFLKNDLVGSLARKASAGDLNESRLIDGLREAKKSHDRAESGELKGGYINEGRQYLSTLSKYQQLPQRKKEMRAYYTQVDLFDGQRQRIPDLLKIKTKTDKLTGQVSRQASFTEFKSNEHKIDQRSDVLKILKIPERVLATAYSFEPQSPGAKSTWVNKHISLGEGGAVVKKFKTVFAGKSPDISEPKETKPLLESRNGSEFIKNTQTRVINTRAKLERF
jgi:hypothetical protein